MLLKSVLFVSLVTLTVALAPKKEQNCAEITHLTENINRFSYNILYRVQNETNGENFVFSPISTWLQLLNILTGADLEHEKEISELTGLGKSRCAHSKVREMINNMASSKSGLNILSVFLADSELDINEDFSDDLKLSDNVAMLELDFMQPRLSAQFANKLISDKIDKEGVLPDIEKIKESDFKSSDILTYDFSYFKLGNAPPVKSNMPFYSADRKFISETEAIQITGTFKMKSFGKKGFTLLKLPTDDEDISMIIILPTRQNKAGVQLVQKPLKYILRNLTPKYAQVTLPLFHIETDIKNMKEILQGMGINKVFNRKEALLQRISDYEISVSSMFQHSTIVFNHFKSLNNDKFDKEIEIKNIKADRPFIYMVVSTKYQLPLLAGVYNSPKQ